MFEATLSEQMTTLLCSGKRGTGVYVVVEGAEAHSPLVLLK